MKYAKMLVITLSLLLFAGAAHAAPWTQAFRNDFQTDSLYLFITEGDGTEFIRWINLPGDWQPGLTEPETLSASGSIINPGRIFTVRFSDRGTFTLEWAEMLGSQIQGAGSLFAADGRFVGASDEFTSFNSLPTPIPGSVWLLGAGLVGLVFIRRKLPSSKG